MTILFYGVPILIGFLLGYFLTLTAIKAVTFTVVLVIIVALVYFHNKEMAALVGMIVATVSVTGLIAMWVTAYATLPELKANLKPAAETILRERSP